MLWKLVRIPWSRARVGNVQPGSDQGSLDPAEELFLRKAQDLYLRRLFRFLGDSIADTD
jgi:hypothetical protein